MKKITLSLVLAIILVSSNAPLLSMETPTAQPQPLVHMQGHLIPDTYSLHISPHTFFSSLGLFISCLGTLLMYKGAQKTAMPALPGTPEANDTNKSLTSTTSEGLWLLGQGSLLTLAGILAIFHQSLLTTK